MYYSWLDSVEKGWNGKEASIVGTEIRFGPPWVVETGDGDFKCVYKESVLFSEVLWGLDKDDVIWYLGCIAEIPNWLA